MLIHQADSPNSSLGIIESSNIELGR